MAKTRIDRRGKIRSMVRKRPEGRGPHWSVTKRAAVWQRRRNLDDVWIADSVTVSDSYWFHWQKNFSEPITVSDVSNINDQKVVISSSTIADSGGIAKDFESPGNTSSATVTDSIGFDKANFNIQFNNNVFNFALLNGIGHSQEFITDSIVVSDGVVLNVGETSSSSASVTDSVGFSFSVGSVFNGSEINLSQLNS